MPYTRSVGLYPSPRGPEHSRGLGASNAPCVPGNGSLWGLCSCALHDGKSAKTTVHPSLLAPCLGCVCPQCHSPPCHSSLTKSPPLPFGHFVFDSTHGGTVPTRSRLSTMLVFLRFPRPAASFLHWTVLRTAEFWRGIVHGL